MNISLSLRRAIRTIAYQSPLHRWMGLGSQRMGAAAWDQGLTGIYSSYLDDTLSIAIRDSLIALIVKRHAPAARVLDIGCARGSLCQALNAEAGQYVGVDISRVAVDAARAQNPEARFHVSPLEEFEPAENFDAIVFNEVLYYADIGSVEDQVRRYVRALGEGGLVIVSMKDDPKSKRIFELLSNSLNWEFGVLEQSKAAPEYRIRTDAAEPASLIGVFSRQKDAH